MRFTTYEIPTPPFMRVAEGADQYGPDLFDDVAFDADQSAVAYAAAERVRARHADEKAPGPLWWGPRRMDSGEDQLAELHREYARSVQAIDENPHLNAEGKKARRAELLEKAKADVEAGGKVVEEVRSGIDAQLAAVDAKLDARPTPVQAETPQHRTLLNLGAKLDQLAAEQTTAMMAAATAGLPDKDVLGLASREIEDGADPEPILRFARWRLRDPIHLKRLEMVAQATTRDRARREILSDPERLELVMERKLLRDLRAQVERRWSYSQRYLGQRPPKIKSFGPGSEE